MWRGGRERSRHRGAMDVVVDEEETPPVPPTEDEIEVFVEELFAARTLPATNHQEWLLRMFSSLMDREARVVSVLEERERAASRRRGGGRGSR